MNHNRKVEMRKLFLLLICTFIIGVETINSQTVQTVFTQQFRAFDTNGPMGDCLFPIDTAGLIVYQGVDTSDYKKEELESMFIRFIQQLENIGIYDIRELESGKRYDINISVGKELVNIGYAQWERDKSTVRCHVKLEYKDGRYRYTVNPYETNRWTIKGEGKSDGHPNVLHWQRVNSLTKEQEEFASKHNLKREKFQREYNEYTARIAEENSSYQAEYDAVTLLVSRISNFCDELKAFDEEEDF